MIFECAGRRLLETGHGFVSVSDNFAFLPWPGCCEASLWRVRLVCLRCCATLGEGYLFWRCEDADRLKAALRASKNCSVATSHAAGPSG